jgi:hypothetical protein
MERIREYLGEAVTLLASGLTAIATIKNPQGATKLCFHVDIATQAGDDFDIFGRAHGSAQLQNFTPADFASIPAASRIKAALVHTTSSGAYVDANLNGLAVTENGYFEMDITGLTEVVVKMSAAVDGAVVTPRWSLS